MSLGERIREASENAGGLNRLADAIDTPRRTLGDWVSGSSEPKASALGKIAQATGVNMNWLVLGEGDKERGSLAAQTTIDEALIERLSRVVEQVYREAEQKIPPARLVRETITLYNQLCERVSDPNDREEMETTLPQLRYLLRKRLTEAEPGSGKASA